MLGNLSLLLLVGLTIGIQLPAIASAKQTTTLTKTIRMARHPGKKFRFHPPSRAHFLLFRDEIEALAKAASNCDENRRKKSNLSLNRMGMEVVPLRTGGKVFWVVREQSPVFRGSGVYICRCNQATPLIIQAPHSYHDTHTGRIARMLFRTTQARWLFLNTFQRYRASAHPEDPNAFHPADCSHNPHLLFQAATLGLLQSFQPDRYLFVQLHGFDANERIPGVVLSDGQRKSATWSTRLRSAWTSRHFKTHIYPKDIRELGGTSNVQAMAINSRSGRFVHLEMDLALRKHLKKNAKSIRDLSRALTKTAGSKKNLYRKNEKD